MKNVSESKGHFPVVFASLRQYSQITEVEQSQLVASCFGRSSHRGNMVSNMHNVFCSTSAAECLQVLATLQTSQAHKDLLLGRSHCSSAVR